MIFNVVLDNIFVCKSVWVYLDKEVEKEKIDWMLCVGMVVLFGKDICLWEFVLVIDWVVFDLMVVVLFYVKMLI